MGGNVSDGSTLPGSSSNQTKPRIRSGFHQSLAYSLRLGQSRADPPMPNRMWSRFKPSVALVTTGSRSSSIFVSGETVWRGCQGKATGLPCHSCRGCSQQERWFLPDEKTRENHANVEKARDRIRTAKMWVRPSRHAHLLDLFLKRSWIYIFQCFHL